MWVEKQRILMESFINVRFFSDSGCSNKSLQSKHNFNKFCCLWIPKSSCKKSLHQWFKPIYCLLQNFITVQTTFRNRKPVDQADSSGSFLILCSLDTAWANCAWNCRQQPPVTSPNHGLLSVCPGSFIWYIFSWALAEFTANLSA